MVNQAKSRQDQEVLNANFDLTTSSVLVLGARANRVSALFVNQSDTVAYLMKGATAAASSGARLNALGGNYEINALNPYYGPIYAVSAGSAKRLSVEEVFYP